MWRGIFFFQAEDGIRDLVRSRGLGDVYKRQGQTALNCAMALHERGVLERYNCPLIGANVEAIQLGEDREKFKGCLLYTSDAADERSSVDLGGRRIIKKKNKQSQVV